MFDLSDLAGLFHNDDQTGTHPDTADMENNNLSEYGDSGFGEVHHSAAEGILHSHVNDADDEALNDDSYKYSQEDSNTTDHASVYPEHHDSSSNGNTDNNPEQGENKQTDEPYQVSFKGFGRCSRCSCRDFEGSGECCDNCGHNYSDHY